jgi:hypothetical protein
MRTNIDAMLYELVLECDETFAVAVRVSNDEWSAILFATSSPMPIFDRRGELQLSGNGATMEEALDALDARCAIR